MLPRPSFDPIGVRDMQAKPDRELYEKVLVSLQSIAKGVKTTRNWVSFIGWVSLIGALLSIFRACMPFIGTPAEWARLYIAFARLLDAVFQSIGSLF